MSEGWYGSFPNYHGLGKIWLISSDVIPEYKGRIHEGTLDFLSFHFTHRLSGTHHIQDNLQVWKSMQVTQSFCTFLKEDTHHTTFSSNVDM